MSSKNDWFAANLNRPDLGMDDMIKAGITPDNTTLHDSDYYKNIAQVKDAFTDEKTGKFKDEEYNAFYETILRTYNTFTNADYLDHWLESLESSPYDIFSLDEPSFDTTVKIIRNRDPQRRSVGIAGPNVLGKPSFDEREVAQANLVRDAQGNKLDFTPNDLGPIGLLTGKSYAMAQYDEDGFYDENGVQVFHKKGERKYDPTTGDPYYEELGDRSAAGREMLHISDILYDDDSWWGKNVAFLDSDSLDKSIFSTIGKTFMQVAPFALPYVGPYMGAVKAIIDFSSVLPKIAKSIDGIFTGDANDSDFGKSMDKFDTFMKKFDKSQTQYAQEHQWAFENIGDMIGSTAGQLYSQRAIWKIPQLFEKSKAIGHLDKVGSNLSLGYMALTSAEEAYQDFKDAGASDRMAGLGFLLTAASYYGLMNHDYFKDWFAKNSGLVTNPEMRHVTRGIAAKEVAAINKYLSDKKLVSTAANLSEATEKAEMGTAKKLWDGLKKFWGKLPHGKAFPDLHVFANHALNEGIEETMEEGVIDVIKGIAEGAEALGFKVTDDEHEKLDFKWNGSEMLNRYLTSFVGGGVGGATFELMSRWENYWRRGFGKIDSFSSYDLDRKFRWYILNGHEKDLRDAIEYERKKGNLGNKNLSWNGHTSKDSAGKASWVFDAVSEKDSGTSINDQMAKLLNGKIDAIKSQMSNLGLSLINNIDELRSRDKFVSMAEKNMEEAAAKEGINVEQYKKKHGWTLLERIINDSRVDDSIFNDVSFYQQKIADLDTRIENIKAAERTHETDGNKADIEERIKNNATIKFLQKQLDTAKKEYEELLKGSRSAEYWGISVFAHNDLLRTLHLNNLQNEPLGPDEHREQISNRLLMSKNVKYYTKVAYGEDYDSLPEDTQNFINEEWSALNQAGNSTDSPTFRHAYNIHRRMLDRMDPAIKATLASLSTDDGQVLIDSILMDQTLYYYIDTENQLAKEANEQFQDIVDQLEEKEIAGTLTEEEAEQLEKTRKEIALNNSIIEQNEKFKQSNDPLVLTRALKYGSENDYVANLDSRNWEDDFDISVAVQSLKKYYEFLVANKTILAYENPIYQNVATKAFEKLRERYYDKVKAFQDFDEKNDDRQLAATYIRNLTIDDISDVNSDKFGNLIVVDDEGDIIERFDSIGDFQNKLKELGLNEAYMPLVNEKIRRLIDAFLASPKGEGVDINTKLSDYNTFSETYTLPTEGVYWINANKPNEAGEQSLQGLEGFRTATHMLFQVDGEKNISAKLSKLNATIESLYDAARHNGDLTALIQSAKDIINDTVPNETTQQIIDHLITPFEKLAAELKTIKDLEAKLKPSPVVDLLQDISIMVGDDRMPILDFLKNEVQKNASQADLNEYVMNVNASKQLDTIVAYLDAVEAILAGMSPGGFNDQLNYARNMEGGEPYTVLNEQQNIFYQTELRYIQSRIATLLSISEGHAIPLTERQMNVSINMRPKFIKYFVDIPDEDRIIKDGETIFDPKQLWAVACDDTDINVDMDNITKNNHEEFVKVVWKWEQLLYDTFLKLGTSSRLKVFDSYFKKIINDGGLYDDNKDTNVTNMGAALYFLSIVGMNPTDFRNFYKDTLNRDDDYPFDSQELAIREACAVILARQYAKNLTSKIQATEKSSDDTYITGMKRFQNLLVIMGNTGAGKSKVVVKKALNVLEKFAKKSKKKLDVVAATAHSIRLSEMKTELGVNKTILLTQLIEKLAGKEFKPEDYASGEDGHSCALSKETLEKIKSSNLISPDLFEKGDDTMRILVFDEGTYVSEGEWQALCKAAEALNIFIITTADLHQQYAKRTYKDFSTHAESETTTGLEDGLYLATPTLTVSMRASNEGMYNSIIEFNKQIDKAIKRAKANPALRTDQIISKEQVVHINTQYHDTGSSFSGMRVTDDITEYAKKFDNWTKANGKGNVAIITDQKSKYSALENENVVIITPEEVQGQEYEYVVIDVDTSVPYYSSAKFTLIKALNTWLTRAKQGAVIVGKPEFTNKDSFLIESDDVKSASLKIDIKQSHIDQLNAYKDIIDARYSGYGTPSSEPAKKKKGSSGGTGGSSSSSGSGSSSSNSSSSSSTSTGSIELHNVMQSSPEEDVQAVIDECVNDPDIESTDASSKTAYHDRYHYHQQATKVLSKDKAHVKVDDVYSLEAFYNWLNSDEAAKIIYSDYYANPFGGTNSNDATKKKKVKKFIQAVGYAIFASPNYERNTVAENVKKALTNNPELAGLVKADFITAFVQAIANESKTHFKLQKSAEYDSSAILWYFVETSAKTYAIPLGTIHVDNMTEEFSPSFKLTIKKNNEYALAPLSSKGRVRVPVSRFSDKIGFITSGVVFRPAKKDADGNEIIYRGDSGILKPLPKNVQDFYESRGRFYYLISLMLNSETNLQKQLLSNYFAEVYENSIFKNFTHTKYNGDEWRIEGIQRIIMFKDYLDIATTLATARRGINQDKWGAPGEKDTVRGKLKSWGVTDEDCTTILTTVQGTTADIDSRTHDRTRMGLINHYSPLSHNSRAKLVSALLRHAYVDADASEDEKKAFESWATIRNHFVSNFVLRYLSPTNSRKSEDLSANPKEEYISENGLLVNLYHGDDRGMIHMQVTKGTNNDYNVILTRVFKDENGWRSGSTTSIPINGTAANMRKYGTPEGAFNYREFLKDFLDTDFLKTAFGVDYTVEDLCKKFQDGTLTVIPTTKRTTNYLGSTQPSKFELFYLSDPELAEMMLTDQDTHTSLLESLERASTEIDYIQNFLVADEIFKYDMFVSETGTEDVANSLHFSRKDISKEYETYSWDIADIMLPAYSIGRRNIDNTSDEDDIASITSTTNDYETRLNELKHTYDAGDSYKVHYENGNPILTHNAKQIPFGLKKIGEDYYGVVYENEECKIIKFSNKDTHEVLRSIYETNQHYSNVLYVNDKYRVMQTSDGIYVRPINGAKSDVYVTNVTVGKGFVSSKITLSDNTEVPLQNGDEAKSVWETFNRDTNVSDTIDLGNDTFVCRNTRISLAIYQALTGLEPEWSDFINVQGFVKEGSTIKLKIDDKLIPVTNNSLFNKLFDTKKFKSIIDVLAEALPTHVGEKKSDRIARIKEFVAKVNSSGSNPTLIIALNQFLAENVGKYGVYYQIDTNGIINTIREGDTDVKIAAIKLLQEKDPSKVINIETLKAEKTERDNTWTVHNDDVSIKLKKTGEIWSESKDKIITHDDKSVIIGEINALGDEVVKNALLRYLNGEDIRADIRANPTKFSSKTVAALLMKIRNLNNC